MNKKLIFKVCVYFFGLLGVFFFKDYLMGINHSPVDLSELSGQVKSFQWCSDKAGTLTWKDSAVQAKYKRWTDHALRKKFCNVDIEAVPTGELENAKWVDLAYGADSQASLVKLEWDKQLKVYRAAGLPFKSKKLSLELLDEAH